jgi:molybdopterin converting factor small subunit
MKIKLHISGLFAKGPVIIRHTEEVRDGQSVARVFRNLEDKNVPYLYVIEELASKRNGVRILINGKNHRYEEALIVKLKDSDTISILSKIPDTFWK